MDTCQNPGRKKVLRERVFDTVKRIMSTESQVGDLSLVAAAEETGIDFKVIQRAAMNHDLNPLEVKETVVPSSKNCDVQTEKTLCLRRSVLMDWIQQCTDKADKKGLSLEEYLDEKYFLIRPKTELKMEIELDPEMEAKTKNIESIFRSAIINGDIAMVDGKLDPASFEKWEKELSEMDNVISLSPGDLTINEAICFIDDIIRKTLEGNISRIEGARKEGSVWKIPSHSLAHWYNNDYKPKSPKKYIVMIEGEEEPVVETVVHEEEATCSPKEQIPKKAKPSITIPNHGFSGMMIKLIVNVPVGYNDLIVSEMIVEDAILNTVPPDYIRAARSMMNDPDVEKRSVSVELSVSNLNLVARAVADAECDSLDVFVLGVIMAHL